MAIRAENVGKQFHIGELQPLSKNFREVAVDAFLGPFRKMRSLLHGESGGAADLKASMWALQDVGFEVRHGEVVGIIGHNGAGKSTLLKILSRITEPTTGYVDIEGRVGSLLEVGTGFHLELTGRENVYLNGAILGMRKAEIGRKFDEIVAFAGTDRFIDTPVKHYSTGMQTRLGFAVAAHLDPEILVVDEVLSVGDAAFQKKCLGKMRDVAKGGRTVVFVSHNVGSVAQLCGRVIWLDRGRIRSIGDPPKMIAEYLSESGGTQSEWINPSEGPGHREAKFLSVRVSGSSGQPTAVVSFDEDFSVELRYQVTETIGGLVMLCRVTNDRGNVMWTSWDSDSPGGVPGIRKPGRYVSICHVPANLLRPGRYYLTVAAFDQGRGDLAVHEEVMAFDVSDIGFRMNHDRTGVITPVLDWQMMRTGDLEAAG